MFLGNVGLTAVLSVTSAGATEKDHFELCAAVLAMNYGRFHVGNLNKY